MTDAKKARRWSLIDTIVENPILLVALTLAAIVICQELIQGKVFVNEIFVKGDCSDVLLRAVTNGANHAHPWLATSVTIVVLILIIVVIILYAGALDEM